MQFNSIEISWLLPFDISLRELSVGVRVCASRKPQTGEVAERSKALPC